MKTHLHEKTSRRHIARALVIVIALIVAVPIRAHATVADIVLLLNTITTTLQQQIGQALSFIQKAESQISNTRQQLVWPVSAIKEANAFASQMQRQYVPLLQAIRQLPTNSAGLQDTTGLESMVRSHNAINILSLGQRYAGVYGQVPSTGDATPLQRNIVDMDDALALGSLKQTVASDQSSEQMLDFANLLERQATGAAPGSAAYVKVEAQLASLQTQAQFLKMAASTLRVEAGHLAHENAVLKLRAMKAHELRNQLQNVLARP